MCASCLSESRCSSRSGGVYTKSTEHSGMNAKHCSPSPRRPVHSVPARTDTGLFLEGWRGLDITGQGVSLGNDAQCICTRTGPALTFAPLDSQLVHGPGAGMGAADPAPAAGAAPQVIGRGAEGARVHRGRVAAWAWWHAQRIRIRTQNSQVNKKPARTAFHAGFTGSAVQCSCYGPKEPARLPTHTQGVTPVRDSLRRHVTPG
jgi:hypothetical protein